MSEGSYSYSYSYSDDENDLDEAVKAGEDVNVVIEKESEEVVSDEEEEADSVPPPPPAEDFAMQRAVSVKMSVSVVRTEEEEVVVSQGSSSSDEDSEDEVHDSDEQSEKTAAEDSVTAAPESSEGEQEEAASASSRSGISGSVSSDESKHDDSEVEDGSRKSGNEKEEEVEAKVQQPAPAAGAETGQQSAAPSQSDAVSSSTAAQSNDSSDSSSSDEEVHENVVSVKEQASSTVVAAADDSTDKQADKALRRERRKSLQNVLTAAKAGKAALTCRALYDYKPVADGHVKIRAGELIVSVSRVTDDWLRGVTPSGELGLFPSSYVQMITAGLDAGGKGVDKKPEKIKEDDEEAGGGGSSSTSSAVAGEKKTQKTTAILDGTKLPRSVIPLHNFEPRRPEELALKKGVRLRVLDGNPKGGWWKCRDREGNVGVAPSNYCMFSDEISDGDSGPDESSSESPSPRSGREVSSSRSRSSSSRSSSSSYSSSSSSRSQSPTGSSSRKGESADGAGGGDAAPAGTKPKPDIYKEQVSWEAVMQKAGVAVPQPLAATAAAAAGSSSGGGGGGGATGSSSEASSGKSLCEMCSQAPAVERVGFMTATGEHESRLMCTSCAKVSRGVLDQHQEEQAAAAAAQAAAAASNFGPLLPDDTLVPSGESIAEEDSHPHHHPHQRRGSTAASEAVSASAAVAAAVAKAANSGTPAGGASPSKKSAAAEGTSAGSGKRERRRSRSAKEMSAVDPATLKSALGEPSKRRDKDRDRKDRGRRDRDRDRDREKEHISSSKKLQRFLDSRRMVRLAPRSADLDGIGIDGAEEEKDGLRSVASVFECAVLVASHKPGQIAETLDKALASLVAAAITSGSDADRFDFKRVSHYVWRCRSGANGELKMEFEVVRVALLPSLVGVAVRRAAGDAWLAKRLLEQLRPSLSLKDKHTGDVNAAEWQLAVTRSAGMLAERASAGLEFGPETQHADEAQRWLSKQLLQLSDHRDHVSHELRRTETRLRHTDASKRERAALEKMYQTLQRELADVDSRVQVAELCVSRDTVTIEQALRQHLAQRVALEEQIEIAKRRMLSKTSASKQDRANALDLLAELESRMAVVRSKVSVLERKVRSDELHKKSRR